MPQVELIRFQGTFEVNNAGYEHYRTLATPLC